MISYILKQNEGSFCLPKAVAASKVLKSKFTDELHVIIFPIPESLNLIKVKISFRKILFTVFSSIFSKIKKTEIFFDEILLQG